MKVENPMDSLNHPPFGKKLAGFSETIGKDKDERLARNSLRDLMLFNNALETEMRRIATASKSGSPIDHLLLEKMTFVKEKYNYAMSGFKAFDDDMQREAMSVLADAIQDLMIYIHNRREH